MSNHLADDFSELLSKRGVLIKVKVSHVKFTDDPPKVESIEYYENSDELKIFFKNGIYVSTVESFISRNIYWIRPHAFFFDLSHNTLTSLG